MTPRRLATPTLAFAAVALALRSARVREWLGDLLISTGCHLLGPPPESNADDERLERIAEAIRADALSKRNGRVDEGRRPTSPRI